MWRVSQQKHDTGEYEQWDCKTRTSALRELARIIALATKKEPFTEWKFGIYRY